MLRRLLIPQALVAACDVRARDLGESLVLSRNLLGGAQEAEIKWQCSRVVARIESAASSVIQGVQDVDMRGVKVRLQHLKNARINLTSIVMRTTCIETVCPASEGQHLRQKLGLNGRLCVNRCGQQRAGPSMVSLLRNCRGQQRQNIGSVSIRHGFAFPSSFSPE